MPARIIQTNTTPFDKVAVEPITLDIIENALRNARAEMDAVLFRTAMSQWAELHPLPGEPQALVQQKVTFEAETHHKLGLLPRREFGLRVMV